MITATRIHNFVDRISGSTPNTTITTTDTTNSTAVNNNSNNNVGPYEHSKYSNSQRKFHQSSKNINTGTTTTTTTTATAINGSSRHTTNSKLGGTGLSSKTPTLYHRKMTEYMKHEMLKLMETMIDELFPCPTTTTTTTSLNDSSTSSSAATTTTTQISQKLHPNKVSPTTTIKKLPEFSEFLRYVTHRTRTPIPCIALALLYLTRLRINHINSRGSPGSNYRLAISSLCVATKFLYDDAYHTCSWVQVSMGLFDQKEINQMEMEFMYFLYYQLAVDPNEWVEWIATLEAKLGKQWEMSKNRKNLAPGLADEREDEGFKEFAGHVLVDECCTNFDDRVWIKENSWGEVGKELVRRFEVAIQGPQQQKQQQQQQQKKKNQNIVNNNYKDGPVVNVLSTPDSIVAGHPPPSQSIPDSMDIDYATNTTTNEGRYSKNIYTESTVPMKGSVSCRSTVTPAANKNTTTTTTTTNNSSGSNRFGWNRKATIGTTAKNLHPSVSSHDLRAVAAVGIASSSSAMSSNTSIIPPVPTVVRRHPTSSSSSSSSSSSLTSTSKYNANLNPTSPLASINTTTAQGIITPSYKSTTSPIGGHDNNALHYHYHHHHHHPYAGQNPGKFSVSSSSIPIPSIKSMKYYNNNDVDGPVIIVKERQSIDSATTGDDNSNQNPWYQPIHTNTIEGSSAYMGLSSSSSTSLCTENLGTGGNTVVAGNPRALESSKSLVNQPPHPPSSSSSSLYHYNSTTKGDGVSYGNSVGGNRAQGFAYGYSHGHGKEGSSTAVHLPLYHYHHSNHSQPELSSTSSSNNTKYHKIPTTTTATTTPGGGGGGGNNSYSILSLSKLKKNSTIAISNAAAVSASNHRRRIIKGLTFNSSSNNNTNTNTNSNRGSNKYVN